MAGPVVPLSDEVSVPPHAVALVADATESSVLGPKGALAPGAPSPQPSLSDPEVLDAPLSSLLPALHSFVPAFDAFGTGAEFAATSAFETTDVVHLSREGEMVRPPGGKKQRAYRLRRT